MGAKHPLITRAPRFRMLFHARDAPRDAARDAIATVKGVHVYIEKTMEKHRNRIKKTVKNYYCMSDIACLHQGDRLKTALQCFTEPL